MYCRSATCIHIVAITYNVYECHLPTLLYIILKRFILAVNVLLIIIITIVYKELCIYNYIYGSVFT